MRKTDFLLTFLFSSLLFSGCASLSTLGLEQQILSSDQRVMSETEAAEIVNQVLKSQNITYQNTVQDSKVTLILNRLSQAAGSHSRFTARLYESADANAFSIGGKYVFVSSGMMEAFKNDQDLLAGVLGHEIAHDIAGHHARQATAAYWQNYAANLAAKVSKGNKAVDYATKASSTLLSLQYSRTQEKEADILGTIWASRAGFDPSGLIRFFEKTGGGANSNKFVSLLSTHPMHPDRIRTVQLTLNYVQKKMTLSQITAQDAQIGKVVQSLEKIGGYSSQASITNSVPVRQN